MMDVTEFGPSFFSLQGKTAMVTGGNGGLGRAFTLALASAGADVFVPSLVDDDGTTQKLVESLGRRYVFAQTDVTAPDAPRHAVKSCVDTLGGLDILVNSAGINLLSDDVTAFGREKWDPMIAVNLTATFDFARAAASVMIPQGCGKIVNIASLFSFLGGRQSPAYAASKAGVVGFTKAYADELGGFGVQVNAIAPGYFATPLTEKTRSDAAANARVIDHVPAGRWGDPADLMGALVFLSSRASDYVTGHTLVVDGGYLLR
ncbi:SDR family oxidoreductase [Microbacterium sp. lyk4-40-TSB-66]|uniref:SDR family oxidoreductase n=1 Tax=Microbacterium sp. lyk4-40-TSB-66 TaxID=3040294 RepID=UPI00254CC36B|nr:SDR family oxidoreductase [Microbacterium sp. lyk4-40-TSB-66]